MRIFKVVKAIVAPRVTFENILSTQKYKKNTYIKQGDISILGISKL